MAALVDEGLPGESPALSRERPMSACHCRGGNVKPSVLSCDLGTIGAISMLTSRQESPSGSSRMARRKRTGRPRTVKLKLFPNQLRRRKLSPVVTPRWRTPQVLSAKSPSPAKFLPRPSCRSLHFGLCFSLLSPCSNPLFLWRCHRLPHLRQSHHLHHRRRHRLLGRTERSRRWRWRMRKARNHQPQEQRKMLL